MGIRKILIACSMIALGAIVIGLWPSLAQEAEPDRPWTSDTQKVVVENAFVRVIEERAPPGESQPRHRHPHGLVIALSDYRLEGFSFTENRPTKTVRKSGDVNWVEAVDHTARNAGTAEQHVIRVELKY